MQPLPHTPQSIKNLNIPGVPRPEAVVLRLGALGEAREAVQLPQRRHAVPPARQDLVRVDLFTCVEGW